MKSKFSTIKCIEKSLEKSLEKTRNLYLIYALLFSALFIAIYSYFALLGKAFLVPDGISQHLTALAYYGKLLRDVLHSLFTTGRPNFLQYDWSLGIGADVLTTLHYYVIGDPFTLLSVFVPVKWTMELYHVIVFLKLFCCGLSFIAFCLYHKTEKKAALLASLIYVFCAFNLYCAPRHPFFINPLIYFPLLCLGVDKILSEKKPLLFVLSIFISCVSNFYFFYMLSILTFIYALVRFFFVIEERSLRVFFAYFALALFSYLVGVFLASPVFLPQIAGFLDSARSSESVSRPLTYNLIYYVKTLLSAVSPVMTGSYTFLGFSAVALPLFLFALFQKTTFSKQVRIFSLIVAVFLSFPFFGSAFNGLGYVSNRWCFSLAFLVAFCVAKVLPDVKKADFKELKLPLLISFALSIMVILASIVSKKTRVQFMIFYLVLLAFVIVFAIFKLNKKSTSALLTLFALLSIFINGNGRYNKHILNYIEKFYTWDAGKASLTFNAQYPTQNEFYRVDTKNYPTANTASVLKTPGTTFYWSEASASLFDFVKSQSLFDAGGLRLNSFDERKILEDIFCVKYKYLKNGEVAKNPDFLPFGITYSEFIKESDFFPLPPLERQTALLKYAILNEKEDFDVDYSTPQSPLETFDEEFTFSDFTNLELKDNFFKVKKDNATLTLKCNTKPNTERYLYIKNLFFKSSPAKPFIEISDNLGTKKVAELPKKANGRGGDIFVCLNHSAEPIKEVTVRFKVKGEYSFDKISLQSLSFENYDKLISPLKEDTLKDTLFEKNKISAKVHLAKRKLLCLTIPFTKNWKATVDGEPQRLIKTQNGLTGLFLEKGEHTIKLQYSTRFAKLGFLLLALGVITLFFYFFKSSRS